MSKNIVLIGMPGCGKSTIGNILSQKLNMPFIDMDSYIEEKENISIKQMFAISEKYFRDMETKHSIAISQMDSNIVASGGGIVKRQENMMCFKNNSQIIFINRPVDTIIKDIDTNVRPLLSEGKEKLYQLYNERISLYKEYCDVEISNTGEISEIVDLILKELNRDG